MRTSSYVVVGVVLVAASAMVLTASNHTYVGADKCKMCHKVEYNSWLETTHAKSTDAAKASTDRAWGEDCLRCHTTNSDEALPGVQCEACHGPGSDYRKMSVMKDRALSIANGLVIPSQETCDSCHVGDDHAKKVSYEEHKGNVKAIHAQKGAE